MSVLAFHFFRRRRQRQADRATWLRREPCTKDLFELLFIHLENEDNNHSSLPGLQCLEYTKYLIYDTYHYNYYKGENNIYMKGKHQASLMCFWKITELSQITQKYIPKIPAEASWGFT